jgi:diguanylate cyclase (GGDEF)-like protein
MKRLAAAALIILGYASVLWAAPAPLTTLKALKLLSNDEARQGQAVAFEGTVTYFRGYQSVLFVQDGSDAIFVKASTSTALLPGDRVLVKGVMTPGFRPLVVSNDVTLLRHGSLPSPVSATADGMMRARYDSMLITLRGIVRSADVNQSPEIQGRGSILGIATDSGIIYAFLNSSDAATLKGLLDAEVEVTAVSSGLIDGKMRQTEAVLNIANLAGIKVLKPASTDPWSSPVSSMNDVLQAYHWQSMSQRVRVHGTVTYYEPGVVLVLQNGNSSLWVSTRSYVPMQVGDEADAIGFPSVAQGFLVLGGSEIRDDQISAPVAPALLDWKELASNRHFDDLVSVDAQVMMLARESSQDEYVLLADGKLFSAVYRHWDSAGNLPPVPEIAVGSTVRVTGICFVQGADPFNGNVPFQVLLRSPEDVAVLSEPSWINMRHLSWLIWLLLLALAGLGTREWLVERKVRRQIGVLAYVEQRRGRILEDVNNSRPLAEILERITELVSVKLQGAACWCRLADGTKLGNSPPDLSAASLRVMERPIAARSGPAHGTLYTAFDSYTKPDPLEEEAMAMGAGLATLAIETSRLYSDLVHRSEYDLLTDIENRFSFERHLEKLIQAARHSSGVFGLLYVDLNEFKLVNDVHGHRAGDLYLQQVALRMKRQLRPGDMLARLGGDEFAVLVLSVRSRSDVQDIALRLECCFEEPFIGDGFVVHGSAAIGIALYPEDGATKDSLLNTADAAMYVTKQTKPRRDGQAALHSAPELAPKDRT